MRLQRYLNEKFFVGAKARNHYFEIFVNPTSKEFDELHRAHQNLRFILDVHQKKIYMWSADVIHVDMLEASSDLMKALGMKEPEDLYMGTLDDYSRIFTGTLEGGRTLSDSFPGDFMSSYRVKPWVESILPELKKLLASDKSFASKSINIGAVNKAIEKTIHDAKKLLGGADEV